MRSGGKEVQWCEGECVCVCGVQEREVLVMIRKKKGMHLARLAESDVLG